jgi:hypothetical protein
LTLFKKIRQEGIDIAADYYTRILPEKEFVHEFARTFDLSFSKLVFSPESGSERIRSINHFHNSYSNKDLFSILDYLESEGVVAELYFSVGNSGESRDEFYTTLQIAGTILTKYRNIVGPGCYPVDIEPCAPFSLSPDKFGLELYRKSFMDFFEFEKRKLLGQVIEHPLGYRTKYMSEVDMIHLSRAFSNMLVQKALAFGQEDDLKEVF